MNLGVIILAAGASSRMNLGRSKLTLPWGQTTILGHLVQAWQHLHAAQLTVVCAPNNEPIQRALDMIAFPLSHRITNPDPARGMFSSIQTAANWPSWVESLTHFAIVLGDQPHIPSSTLAALLAHAAQNAIAVCQPSRNGRARHPVILPRRAFEQIPNTTAATLNEFLEPIPRALLEIPDPTLDLDLDHPEDYTRALREFPDAAQLEALRSY